ncbi:LON peptidase substrate-binding domain-containing protein [Zhongshania sp. BJYM1]|uniref:LON peptidase substrate-binding domain-containing protein n=1 Tax=Zhongshania aquatica TaxID=2965069 RepID=UPI0022B523B1|nr:LON peptidase substrate-binding domain-containing protein [Marortus sp. BJYM1]
MPEVTPGERKEFPFFPLRSVLFPGGRMGLRIFERRYLDMVRDTLRAQDSFGIVWLPEGGKEVLSPGERPSTLALIGTEARIADWDQLPDGLLGVVVEGGRRFRINQAGQADSGLYLGDIAWLPEREDQPLPARSEELHDMLLQLGEHPHVQRLGMTMDIDEAGALANRLAQILPLPAEQAYQLLSIDEPLLRLNALHDVLDSLAS